MRQSVADIKATLAARGLRPRHRFGQNFLIDGSKVDLLVAAAGLSPCDVVLEVGPGTGVLTEALLATGATVVACELDRDLAALVRDRWDDALTLVEGDCLSKGRRLADDVAQAIAGRPFKLVANLPYDAASPLMASLAMHWPACKGQYVTIQKEVADRLTAEPGTRQWGPLGVLVRRTCDVRRLAVLAPGCFWPQPKVTSAMVAIEPARAFDDQGDAFATFVTEVFAGRRKQLGRVAGRAAVEAAGLDPTRRADTLTIDELERLRSHM